MDIESGVLAALTLGFLLGLKHATDADHVVAVSTIVGESRNVWRGIWVGGSWGLGHTTPLLLLGIIILAFRGLMDGYDSVAHVFEFGVGVMMVLLGIQVFWNLKRGRLHIHEHSRDDARHVHIHATHEPAASPDVESRHGFLHLGKPVFRVKSYTIGLVHGLAGSAAVMLVLLDDIPSFWVGLGYLVLFGVGTVLSMAVITILMGGVMGGAPSALVRSLGVAANQLRKVGLQRWADIVEDGHDRLTPVARLTVFSVAGFASVLFGAALMSDIALGTALIPF